MSYAADSFLECVGDMVSEYYDVLAPNLVELVSVEVSGLDMRISLEFFPGTTDAQARAVWPKFDSERSERLVAELIQQAPDENAMRQWVIWLSKFLTGFERKVRPYRWQQVHDPDNHNHALDTRVYTLMGAPYPTFCIPGVANVYDFHDETPGQIEPMQRGDSPMMDAFEDAVRGEAPCGDMLETLDQDRYNADANIDWLRSLTEGIDDGEGNG